MDAGYGKKFSCRCCAVCGGYSRASPCGSFCARSTAMSHIAWIASARSAAMSLREMRERILDMTSGRERPLTKTTYLSPGNTSSYSRFNFARASASSCPPLFSCACSARLCSESTFFSPRRGCAHRISDRVVMASGDVEEARVVSWVWMATIRAG